MPLHGNHQTVSCFHVYWNFTSMLQPTIQEEDENYPNTIQIHLHMLWGNVVKWVRRWTVEHGVEGSSPTWITSAWVPLCALEQGTSLFVPLSKALHSTCSMRQRARYAIPLLYMCSWHTMYTLKNTIGYSKKNRWSSRSVDHTSNMSKLEGPGKSTACLYAVW